MNKPPAIGWLCLRRPKRWVRCFFPRRRYWKQLLLAAERELVDEAADALRAHNGPALLGPQAPGYLLRRKTSLQPVDHQLAQGPVSPARTPAAATPTGLATLPRQVPLVACAIRIPPHLPAQRCRLPPKAPGPLRLGRALPTPGVDLKPFLSREVNISCHTTPWPS
jgi:hypothetical protein